MNKLVEEYIKNGKEIQRIEAESELKRDQIREEKDKAIAKIRDKITVLEKEERDTSHKYDLKVEVTEVEEEHQKKPCDDQRDSVKRIIKFLEVQENYKPIVLNAEVINEWIHDDEYLKIGLKIMSNHKPVNKIDVIVSGACVFRHEPLIKFPYYYDVSLGSFKTTEDAKRFIEKKKSTIGQDVIKQVEELKKEYLEVTKTWKLSDFEKLFEYYCSDCRERFDTNVSAHTRPAWNVKPGDSKQEQCKGNLYRRIKEAV